MEIGDDWLIDLPPDHPQTTPASLGCPQTHPAIQPSQSEIAAEASEILLTNGETLEVKHTKSRRLPAAQPTARTLAPTFHDRVHQPSGLDPVQCDYSGILTPSPDVVWCACP